MVRPHRPARIHPLLVAVTALALAACASTAPPASTPASELRATATAAAAPAFPVELTDDAGRTVSLAEPPERIVSLAPSNTEIVCALEACERLVGVTDFDDYPPEVSDVAEVVVMTQVDVERLVEAEPDLVLAAGNELTPSSVIAQIDELQIPVLVLYPETLDEVYADIELVARAIGKTDAAAELVAEMRERVAAVEQAVAGAERPRTLYEVFHSEGTTYTAGEGSFLESLLQIAGATPVTGDAQGLIDTEELVAADPELILIASASYDPSLATPESALETVAARPGWRELSAVSEGRVVPYLDDIVTTRPGPRIVEGLESLARAIHPERFDDR